MASRSRITGSYGDILPLAFLREGEEGEIVDLRGGRGLVQRLSEMGFTPGTKVRVLHSNQPGPVLISIRDTRIAVGRGVAMKIMVNGFGSGGYRGGGEKR